MTLLVDIFIVLVIALMGFGGYRRGLWLVVCELASVVLATLLALVLYRPLGSMLQRTYHLPLALANVAMFAVVWMLTELLLAVLIRYVIVSHLTRLADPSRPTQILAAALNGAKGVVIVMLALIIIAGAPIATWIKAPLTQAYLSQVLLTAGGGLQSIVMGVIGRDISDSLTVLTLPEGSSQEKAIQLGFTASGTIDSLAETQMLELVNQERTSRGLQPLKLNLAARAVARNYASEVLASGYFSHIDKAGLSPFDRLRAADVPYGAAGENLALSPSLQQAHQALMNSPGHRANILSPVYRTVGIGIIDAGQYGLLVVQDFTD